jgi:plastocyanin
MRPIRAVAPLAVAAFALLAGATAASPSAETLTATVGPNDTISLKKPDGTAVTKLTAGTYTIGVDDQADDHNFHLTGPGVDKATGVSEVGKETWTVTLSNGTYTYLCDPHPRTMRGTFTVGSASTSTQTLVATVTSGSVTLTKGGKRISSLSPGAYRIAVRDRSAGGNVHLTGPGVNRKTSIAGRATTTWKVTLKLGTYMLRSDAGPKVKRTLVVKASA